MWCSMGIILQRAVHRGLTGSCSEKELRPFKMWQIYYFAQWKKKSCMHNKTAAFSVRTHTADGSNEGPESQLLIFGTCMQRDLTIITMANGGGSFAYARQVGQFDSICLPFPSLLSKHTHTQSEWVRKSLLMSIYIFFSFFSLLWRDPSLLESPFSPALRHKKHTRSWLMCPQSAAE